MGRLQCYPPVCKRKQLLRFPVCFPEKIDWKIRGKKKGKKLITTNVKKNSAAVHHIFILHENIH